GPAGAAPAAGAPPRADAAAARGAAAPAAPAAAAERPALPAGIAEGFLPPDPAQPGPPRYEPFLLGVAHLHDVRAKDGLDAWRTLALLAPVPADGSAPWTDARELGRAAPVLA